MEIEPTFPHCYGVAFNPTYVGTKFTCSICMNETIIDDDETDNHLAHFSECAHTACISCLTRWMESGRNDCPQCRAYSDSIQTVKYTLYMANKEFMLLDNEIDGMRHNIEERTATNAILRQQLVSDNDKIRHLEHAYSHYGCNDQITAIDTMEEAAGVSDVPQHLRGQHHIPEVFMRADTIRKTCENEMEFKQNFIQQNIARTAFEMREIHTLKERQQILVLNAQILLSGYSMVMDEPDEDIVDGAAAMDEYIAAMEVDDMSCSAMDVVFPTPPGLVRQSTADLLAHMNNIDFPTPPGLMRLSGADLLAHMNNIDFPTPPGLMRLSGADLLAHTNDI